MPIPILIDCDPGHDDAIALLLTLASPELDLLAVSTVAGNTTLDKTTANALRVLEKAGRSDIEVAAGHDKPLRRPLVVAEHVHGPTGLDGPPLEKPTRAASSEHAVEMLASRIRNQGTPVTLIPMGPLTNIASLLTTHPDIRSQIERIVVMGGAIRGGNTTPYAEFNVFVDPEAAQIVFASGLNVTMIGLDVTHQALMGSTHADILRQAGECGRFVADLLDYFIVQHQDSSVPIHDALAVATVIWPDLVTTRNCTLEVDCTDLDRRGETRESRFGASVRVGVEVDGELFARRVVDRLSTLP